MFSQFNVDRKTLAKLFQHHPVFQQAKRFGARFGVEPKFNLDEAVFNEHGGAFRVGYFKDGQEFPEARGVVRFFFAENGKAIGQAEFFDADQFSARGLSEFIFGSAHAA